MRRYLLGSLVFRPRSQRSELAATSRTLQRPASSAPPGNDHLDAYTAVVLAAEQLATIAQQGLDISDQTTVADGVEVDLVMTPAQRAKLAEEGVEATLTRVKGGQTVRQFAAAQAANGFNVWRSYDEAGGIRDQMYAVAAENPNLAKVVKIGTTGQGREILGGQADRRCTHAQGRRPTGNALLLDPARPRVDRHRGQPPADELVRGPVEC